MVIEDDEAKESHKDEDEHDDDGDDSSDEDWGKNAVLEDAGDEEDVELEEEDDAAERAKGKASGKVESKKRKLGGVEKLEPTKKSKSGTEVNRGAFKLPALKPMNNLEGE